MQGNLMSTVGNLQNSSPQHPLSNKWLNKLTSLLKAKRIQRISQPRSLKPAVRLTSKKAYTSIKSDEEWTSRVLPSEQDDIVNSLNYRHCSNWVAVYTFLTVTDCVLALSQTKQVEWLAVMVISQPPNNPSYYYRASPTLPQLLWMLPETPYILYMQLQHQGSSQKWCY